MTPFSRLYIAECWKLMKRPMTWTLTILLVIFIILVYGTLIATILAPEGIGAVEFEQNGGSLEESLILPDGLYMGIGLVQLLVTVLVIVLAAGMVGSDLAWGTIRTTLMMGAGRTRILAAKLFTLVTAGLVGILFGLVLAIVGSIVTGLVVGEGLLASAWMNNAFLVDAVVLVARALVAVTLWALIAATITLVTRSLAAGLGATLALLFVGGQIGGLLGQLGNVGVWIGRMIPNTAIDALTSLNQISPPDYGAGDWTWILASLVGWTVLMSILAVVTFRRMDTLAAGS